MSNYIDISKQQRVVFVDNISYENAEELSRQYPFALILTNNKDTDAFHTIWRNGYCYSYINKVDRSPITIDTYSINLNISNGELSLQIGNVISDFDLIRYKSENDEYEYNNSGLDIKNKGELFFTIYNTNNESISEYNRDGLNLFDFRIYKDSEPNIDIKDEYISNIQSKKDSDPNFCGIKYVFNVNKEYLENDLKLEVSYKLIGSTIIKTYPLILRKTVEGELIWIGTEYDANEYTDGGIYEIFADNIVEEFNSLGWHYLNNFSNDQFEEVEDYPLRFDNTLIYVIIPESRKLRVKIKENGQYVEDEGNDSSYSYSILRRCIVNGITYKVLKQNREDNDEYINEFINIIR